MTDVAVIDLDSQRASRREAKGQPITIRFGGEEIATLPVELPLEVLAPFVDLDLDMALVMRSVMDLMNAEGGQEQAASIDLMVSLLVNRPSLPLDLLTAAKDSGARLLGQEGFAKFAAQHPSREDVSALVSSLFKFYGVSLGEASAPSELPGGETPPPPSKPTSKRSTKSTTEGSGRSPRKSASSESAAS